MKTYETGDSGVVVSGHDWVGGWRWKRKKRRETRSAGEGTCLGEKTRVMKRAGASGVLLYIGLGSPIDPSTDHR